MRKFIYSPHWTIPIDRILFIENVNQRIEINCTDGIKYIRPEQYGFDISTKEIYEDIQRQLMEAENK